MQHALVCSGDEQSSGPTTKPSLSQRRGVNVGMPKEMILHGLFRELMDLISTIVYQKGHGTVYSISLQHYLTPGQKVLETKHDLT